MADTSHHAAPAPVEGDGISYSGLIWFMVVIAATTIACQLLMWVLLLAFQHQAAASPVPTVPSSQWMRSRHQRSIRNVSSFSILVGGRLLRRAIMGRL